MVMGTAGNNDFYRPQTKVMFSQVSVCPQGVLPHCMLGCTPPGQTPTPHSPGRPLPLCSACWDAVNKRAVRIPLECNLVC